MNAGQVQASFSPILGRQRSSNPILSQGDKLRAGLHGGFARYICWKLLVFTYHVIKRKNRNHSINKVTNEKII